MFNFIPMLGNYDTRRVERHDDGDLIISTAYVTDGSHPYETAVAHPDYNEGSFVIVESYDSKEDAEQGHVRWIDTMTNEPLPDKLVDCANSGISQLALAVGCDEFYRQEEK